MYPKFIPANFLQKWKSQKVAEMNWIHFTFHWAFLTGIITFMYTGPFITGMIMLPYELIMWKMKFMEGHNGCSCYKTLKEAQAQLRI